MLELKRKLMDLELENILNLPKLELNHSFSPASVLVALQYNSHVNKWKVLLTKRSVKLKSFPGQISFPGGNIESTDLNEESTALRETKEEIGVNDLDIEIIIKLPPQILKNKFVYIVIGFLNEYFNVIQMTNLIDSTEVEAVFLAPLDEFLSNRNYSSKSVEFSHGESSLKFHLPSFDLLIQSVILQENKQIINDSFSVHVYGFTAIICIYVAILVLDRPPEFDTVDIEIAAKSANQVYPDMIDRLRSMTKFFSTQFMNSNLFGRL